MPSDSVHPVFSPPQLRTTSTTTTTSMSVGWRHGVRSDARVACLYLYAPQVQPTLGNGRRRRLARRRSHRVVVARHPVCVHVHKYCPTISGEFLCVCAPQTSGAYTSLSRARLSSPDGSFRSNTNRSIYEICLACTFAPCIAQSLKYVQPSGRKEL